jgi:sigma-54 specific flagellar transcriptional regulator A
MAIIYPDEQVDVDNLPEKFQQYKALAGMDEPVHHDNAGDAIAQEKESVTDNDDSPPPALAHLPSEGIDLKEYLTILEEDLIRQALYESNGVVAHAAKRLNMRRTTLVEKLRKLDLER